MIDLLRGVWVLVLYENHTADIVPLPEYVARTEPFAVRDSRIVRGLAKVAAFAEQYRILRGTQQVDTKAVERLVTQVEKAEAPEPSVDEVEPP